MTQRVGVGLLGNVGIHLQLKHKKQRQVDWTYLQALQYNRVCVCVVFSCSSVSVCPNLTCYYVSLYMWVCVCVFGITQVFTQCLNGSRSTGVMWAGTLPLCCQLRADAPTWCRANMFICCVNISRAGFISACEHAEPIRPTMCVREVATGRETETMMVCSGSGSNLIL